MKQDSHTKIVYKNVATKDHHLSRTGRRDSVDKKHGAGKNNWGSLDDVQDGDVIDFFASNARSKGEAVHDHHVSKHGHVDHQDKKKGAGKGNWGTFEDSISVSSKSEVTDVFAEDKVKPEAK